MYLKELELTGFKSFAHKSVLEFPYSSEHGSSVTAIVGPNGSGKSNVVDAIRWALGEQSVKTLRGKTNEDVIFSGSQEKVHLNMAEVSLVFNNEDGKAPIDYQEFTITRRLYRNGDSEYLLNNSQVRLQDILILLAKANFGQKSYSVIGQGMVDQILHATPMERKKFFDEATGVKQYQIKRNEAVRKIEKSKENLRQAEIALNEVEPRMRSLTRQIKKLERRNEIESELRNLQKTYYGKLWRNINQQFLSLKQQLNQELEKQKKIDDELKILQAESEKLVEEKIDTSYHGLQQEYQKLLNEKNVFLEKQAGLRVELAIALEQNKFKGVEKSKIVFNPEKILSALQKIRTLQEDFLKKLDTIANLNELETIKNLAREITQKIDETLKSFKPEEPKTESKNQDKIDNIKQGEANNLQQIEKINQKINELNEAMNKFGEEERLKRKTIFDWQKKVQTKQNEFNIITNKINEFRIELARLETKKDALEEEIKHETGSLDVEQIISAPIEKENVQPEETLINEIYKLKHQMELIGGIDPEVTAEYPKCKERFEFLSSQTTDLREGIKSLEKIIKELDEKTKVQFEQVFAQINQVFDQYFKILFDGGRAKLVLEEVFNQQDIQPGPAAEESQDELPTMNIEILATPPRKKIKSVETLSGGERALTSLALILAIISINRPPFVILDEVDAALDEENSAKFSKILRELSKNSQSIVITHNRQTMEASDILYGVTMGPDSISKLVSLKFEK